MESFFKAFVNSSNPHKTKKWFGYEIARRDGLLDTLSELRDQLRPVSDWFYNNGYFENVYDAALYIELSNGGIWEDNEFPADRYYFRGQRHDWPLVPSLYRVKGDAELQQRLSRLSAVVSALQRTFHNVDQDQAVAIAQHYSSSDNGVKTWFLDVTRQPLVGLFFASDNGAAGQRGILWALRAEEWMRENRLGAIREVTVRMSKRIPAQCGLFLDTPNPQLFDAYSPFVLEFDQVEGLVFEDPYHEPPITRQYLYQEDSELKAIVDSSSQHGSVPSNPSLNMEGHKNPLDPVTVDDFRAIITSWVKRNPQWHKAADPEALGHLCSFHARVFAITKDSTAAENWRDISYVRMLHTLWRATEALIEHPLDAFEDAYLSGVKQASVKTMLKDLLADSLPGARSLF
jgi:hypothetical protein